MPQQTIRFIIDGLLAVNSQAMLLTRLSLCTRSASSCLVMWCKLQTGEQTEPYMHSYVGRAVRAGNALISMRYCKIA